MSKHFWFGGNFGFQVTKGEARTVSDWPGAKVNFMLENSATGLKIEFES
jgi:hypothetical protein